MFLQLHDGPEVPYGLKKYPFPKYTGKLMPVSTAENPYAPGAPVMKLSPYAVLHGCDPQQVYAQFVPQNADGWRTRLSQVKQGEQLVKNYQSLKATAGTGSVPVYDANGVITGYQAGDKTEVVLAWIQLGAKALTLAQEGVRSGEANRLKQDAQALWDQNKWGLQFLCDQTLPQLNANATDCWNSFQWWIQDQSAKMQQWMALPGYKRNNIANPQLAGQLRIANRAVVIRQNALTILVKEIEAKGGSFTPDKTTGTLTPAAILALIAGAAFLRF
jgi:hypothetical protein